MAQLPIPGGDAGTWGTILNDFLEVSLNGDGTIQPSALTAAGGVISVNTITPQSGGNVTLTAANIGAYAKPSTGIPSSDLSSSVQAELTAATTAVQSVNGLTGPTVSLTPSTIGALPTTTKLAGLADTLGAAGASNNQVLAYDSTTSQWIASTVSSTTVNDATTSSKGIVELAGDLGGNAASPSVLKVNGTSVSGTPASGQALIASSSTAAAWSALPSAPVTSVNSQTGAVSLTASEVGAVPTSEVGTASGVASLNSSGQVPTTQLATGSGSTSNYLRGDGSWATPPTGSTTLAGDSDVNLDDPGNFQVLQYDATTSKWTNQWQELGNDADVIVSAPTDGQALLYDGTADKWQNQSLPTASLAGDTDVVISSPTNDQVLTYNGGSSKWVNQTPASGIALDSTSTDIQPLGTQAAGSIGKAADSGHVHAMPRLDQINNPTASVSLNSQKITNLANGSAATDAAAFGQIPTSLPPSGIAAGDLSGAYPSPSVVSTHLSSPLPVNQGGTGSTVQNWTTTLMPSGDTTGATDTANIQSLLNLTGQAVLGVGTFYANGLYPVSFSRLTGQGRDVTSIVTTTSEIFDIGNIYTDSVEIDHLTLNATGADIFGGPTVNCARWYVHDCALVQNSANYSIWNGQIPSTTGVMIECHFERNVEQVYGATRTVESWIMVGSSGSNAINQNVWRDEVCFNENSDDTQYWYHMVATTSSNARNEWRNIVFEYCYGGLIHLESHNGAVIENCLAWDVPGSGGTVSNHLIRINQSTSGSSSAGNTIINSPRAGSATFGAGIQDISLDANSPQTTIIAPQASSPLVDMGASAASIINLSGSPTILNGPTVTGRNMIQVAEATNAIQVIRNISGSPAQASSQIESATSGDKALGLRVHGDADNRLQILASGELQWGSGSIATDTDLYRASAGVLQTDGSLQATDGIGVGTTPGAVGITIAQASGSAELLKITNSTASPTNPTLQIIAASAPDNTMGIEVSGDTTNRWKIDSNGQMKWGSGSATQDLQLTRSAAGSLQVTGISTATQFIIANPNSTPTNPASQVHAAASGDLAFGIEVTADADFRFTSDSNGKLTWGSGSATQDTDLYRASAGVLRTDESLTVGTNLLVDGTLADSFGNDVTAQGAAGATSQTTQSGASAEAIIATIAMPANLPAGATYYIRAWGTVAIGSTSGTITFRTRIGTSATPSSDTQVAADGSGTYTTGTTVGSWTAEGYVQLQTTGAAGTAAWSGTLFHEINISGTVNNSVNTPTSNVTGPASTSPQNLYLTANSSSATNALTCTGSVGYRVS